jgi:hypothetical protein
MMQGTRMKRILFAGLAAAAAWSCQPPRQDPGLQVAAAGVAAAPASDRHTRRPFDEALVIGTLQILAHDSLQGRKPGTEGHAKAQAYLVEKFRALGIDSLGPGYLQPFEAKLRGGGVVPAANIVGVIRGANFPEKYVVVGAHYDHVGVEDGQIHNGADDNASGVGGLLGIASYLKSKPPKHSVLLVAFDAEESGLQGAKHFVAHPAVPLSKVVVMVNMDMISRSDAQEVYASGAGHYPFLKHHLLVAGKAVEPVAMKLGHDVPPKSRNDAQDWTQSSDHGPFHNAGVPYVYFGVEDHPHYHKPSDDFETIDREFYLNVVDLVLRSVVEFDQHLGLIEQQRLQQRR